MTDKPVISFDEFQRTYFPNSVLDRLEERLCERLKLIHKAESRLEKNETDPKIGTISFSKREHYITPLTDIVKVFFIGEGYKVSKGKGTMFEVSDGAINYWIIASETGYVSVNRPPF